MNTYEILTIILTVFSGIVAVSAILVPIILNYLTKRAENKINGPKAQDKLRFNEYRLKYMKLVDELSLSFSKYITNLNEDDKAILMSNIFKLKIISDHFLKSKLNDLLIEVQSEIFDKNKLISVFNKFLENIKEKDFSYYWYGFPFYDEAHSDLINNNNKNNRSNLK